MPDTETAPSVQEGMASWVEGLFTGGDTATVATPDSVWSPDHGFSPVLTYALMGVCAALAIAVVIQAVALLMHKKRLVKAKNVKNVTVGKLHCQGARESQQDCFAVSPSELFASHGLLAVVADGMGGLADGDKVSQLTVSTIFDGFLAAPGTADNILPELTQRANTLVNRMLGSRVGKCGTTLVAGLIRGGKFHYLSVGDSRICLYRNGQLIQLNREHVYRRDLTIQAINGKGSVQAAASHPQAGGLTSYLGMGELKHVDMPDQPIEILGGDKFILMSDGVFNALTRRELCQALDLEPEAAATKLETMIRKKNHRNQDNYTAVILSC